ncbi:MAG: pantoate--beta-alanine ligase [Elusimicrobia bacterium]|nr:pantoate--beta-alanine ligase [Elusimicrobiota bacterium]
MRIVKKPQEMARLSVLWRTQGLSVGFVPTMGALHRGHASLIKRARKENLKIAVSIFVNPAQFGPREDFSRYPRPFAEDSRLCAGLGVDALYHPDAAGMYPEGYATCVEVAGLSDILCGAFRPGHFRGVATVVLKLLEMVSPSKAYFGEKDYQQLIIVKRMARDLNLPCRIVGCPTVREADGLALSSRNKYLSPEERRLAPALYAALKAGARAAKKGGPAKKVAAVAERRILRIPGASIDYVSLVEAESLREASALAGKLRLMAAVRLGSTRLIDNIPVMMG